MEYHHPVRVFLRRLTGVRRDLQRVVFRWLFRWVPFSSRLLGPPRGVCVDLPDWIARRQESPPAARPSFQPVHPASRVAYPPTAAAGSADNRPLFELPPTADLPAAGLCALPGGRIFGRRLAVITPDDRVIASLSGDFGRDIRSHFVFSRPKLPAITRLAGTTGFLGCVSGNNYYHWVLDCLPVLDVLQRGGFDLRSADHLVFTGVQQPFQQEMLRALGVPLEKIVETDRVRHIEAETLVCSSTQILNGGFPAWACDFLRTQVAAALLPDGPQQKRRRLFVSRSDAAFRRVANEAELMPILERHGFERLILGPLAVRDQVAAFASAEIVVAPHGAGLTNLVFSPPGTTLVELFAPQYQNPCYYQLCCTAGHRYHALLGEAGAGPSRKIPEMTRLDMTIAPQKLEALLRDLLA